MLSFIGQYFGSDETRTYLNPNNPYFLPSYQPKVFLKGITWIPHRSSNQTWMFLIIRLVLHLISSNRVDPIFSFDAFRIGIPWDCPLNLHWFLTSLSIIINVKCFLEYLLVTILVARVTKLCINNSGRGTFLALLQNICHIYVAFARVCYGKNRIYDKLVFWQLIHLCGCVSKEYWWTGF